jgi:predicted DNA-binding transcriptional regulator AlpA
VPQAAGGRPGAYRLVAPRRHPAPGPPLPRPARASSSASLFYQAGIQAVIALAAIYAQEAMRFTTEQTLR